MQQRFSTRNYSIRDFEEWHDKGELVLQPKFQRRTVWKDKARSYLIDTIVRGKPIPKIYMRQDIHPETNRTNREIVDGQQRLHTVLLFIKDGFKISKSHSKEYGGKYFSQLNSQLQRDIRKYEFSVDLLQDMPDNDIYDVFARINTYSVKLNAQELRNAQWYGDFKSSVYELSTEFITFWESNNIFAASQILRMAEAEFVSELLIAISLGIREGKKDIIDSHYNKWDNVFPNRTLHEKRFRQVLDDISGILGEDLSQWNFRATRIFYPLFCAVYHMKYSLPQLNVPRRNYKIGDYPKLKNALEQLELLIEKIKAAEKVRGQPDLSAEEARIEDAYNVRWVHADKRKTITEYICKLLMKALRG